MTRNFHLTSHHLCPYVQRAIIVLTEKDIPHQRTYIDLADKPDWFTAASPLGKVPILQTGNAVVFESQVIAEYIDEITPESLHPADPLEKARHRSWIEYGSATLNSISGFYNAKGENAFEESRLVLRGKFERIEQEIAGPFFAGSRFYMVDGVWGTIFRYLDVFEKFADFGLLNDLEKVKTWRNIVMTRPSVITAPPEGYPEHLTQFLKQREAQISTLIA